MADRPRRRLVGFLAVVLAITGCRIVPRVPHVVNHREPAHGVDNSVFTSAGCPPDDLGRRHCAEGSPIKRFACDALEDLPASAGGLSPVYPLARCLVLSPGRLPGPATFVFDRECLAPSYARYVVYRAGRFELLRSPDEVRAVFAPIESAHEALSYALVQTGLAARYGLSAEPELRYFTSVIEDTHVEAVQGGYVVHLFQRQVCGCGPHPTWAIAVRVTRDGAVGEPSRRKLYEDPSEDSLCIKSH